MASNAGKLLMRLEMLVGKTLAEKYWDSFNELIRDLIAQGKKDTAIVNAMAKAIRQREENEEFEPLQPNADGWIRFRPVQDRLDIGNRVRLAPNQYGVVDRGLKNGAYGIMVDGSKYTVPEGCITDWRP